MQLEIIRGQGLTSNVFILIENSKKKIVIIDLGLSGTFTNFELRNKLNEIFKGDTEVEIEVFLTHCHLDHILGSDNLSNFKNIQYSASPHTAKHINEKDAVTLISLYGGSINYSVTKTYDNIERIPFEGAELEVYHAPGHTDGCAVIYDKMSKSLFAGDVVFAGAGCGRVDLPTGNRKTLSNSLAKLAELEVEHLYSGHGPDLHKNVQENIQAAKGMLDW